MILGTVVTLMDTSNVDSVFIAGKIVKRSGKLVGVDLQKIRGAAETSRNAVLERAKYSRNLFGSCCAGPS